MSGPFWGDLVRGQVVTAESFGASASNSSAQNTGAIQRALNKTGAVSINTPGTYLINGSLTAYDNTYFYTAPGVILKNEAGSYRNMIVNSKFNQASKGITSLTTADGITVTATVASLSNLPALDDAVVILGASPSVYNGGHIVTAINTGSLTFQYKLTADDAPSETITSPATGTIVWYPANKNIFLDFGVIDYNGANMSGSDSYLKHAIILSNVVNGGISERTEFRNATKYAACLHGCYHFQAGGMFRTTSDGLHFAGHGKDLTVTGAHGYTGDDMVAFGQGDYSQYKWPNYSEGDFDGLNVQLIRPQGSLTAFKYFGSSTGTIDNLYIGTVSGRISGGGGFVNFIFDSLAGSTGATLGRVSFGNINSTVQSVKPALLIGANVTLDSLQGDSVAMVPGNNNNACVLHSSGTVGTVQIGKISYKAPSYQSASIGVNIAGGTIGLLQVGELHAKNVGICVFSASGSSGGTIVNISQFITDNCGQGVKFSSANNRLYVGYGERNGYQSSPFVDFTGAGNEISFVSGRALVANDAFGGTGANKVIRNCAGIGIDIGGTGVLRTANAVCVQKSASARGTIVDGSLVVCDTTATANSWKQLSDTTKTY